MHAGPHAHPEAGSGASEPGPAAQPGDGAQAPPGDGGQAPPGPRQQGSPPPADGTSARPQPSGPVGVSALLAAVRAVPGVRDAQVRTSADGDRTLRLDLADGADGLTVAALVSQVLDERLGVVVDPTRSFMVEDASAGEDYRAPVDAPRRRVLMERLQVVTGGLDASVDVGLTSAESKVVGTATGPAVEAAVLRTVATATLNAVDALIEGRGRCGLDQAEVTEIGSDRVAVAVVTLLTPGRVDRLVGAALVRGDARQAMARAVLAALNRQLESLLPEPLPPPGPPTPDPAAAPPADPAAEHPTGAPGRHPSGEIGVAPGASGVGWPSAGGAVDAVRAGSTTSEVPTVNGSGPAPHAPHPVHGARQPLARPFPSDLAETGH